jgi:hypothetical protein
MKIREDYAKRGKCTLRTSQLAIMALAAIGSISISAASQAASVGGAANVSSPAIYYVNTQYNTAYTGLANPGGASSGSGTSIQSVQVTETYQNYPSSTILFVAICGASAGCTGWGQANYDQTTTLSTSFFNGKTNQQFEAYYELYYGNGSQQLPLQNVAVAGFTTFTVNYTY